MSDTKFLEYKGKPLVRNENTIYYGDMADPYVVMLQIQSVKNENSAEVPDNVLVQLMATDPTVAPKDIVKKHAEKKGLYEALDIASIWLKRALNS